MSQRHTPRAIRLFDTFKYFVLLLLLVILIILLIARGCQNELAPRAATELTPVPTYTAVVERVRPLLVSPATGAQVAAGTVELRGSAQAGATLQVLIDNELVDTTTVGADGAWTYTAQLDESGVHALQLRTTDSSGNPLEASEPITLSVEIPVAVAQAPTLDRNLLPQFLAPGPIILAGEGEAVQPCRSWWMTLLPR
jgi:Bacterial Ig-like domain